MNEIRKVIAAFEEPVLTKEGNSFPVVRAWIIGQNDYETKDLRHHFPTRGTVFLRAGLLTRLHPESHQVGLFYCEAALGQSASWKVQSVSDHLAKVVEYPGWDMNQDMVAFSQWLAAHHEPPSTNGPWAIQTAYISRAKGELVGPFSVSSEGRLTPRGQILLHEGIEPIAFDVGGKRRTFIDTQLLPKGKAIIPDLRDAIHRQLKLAAQSGQLNWLSRDKIRDLSTALAAVVAQEDSEWVLADLSRALSALSLTNGLGEKFSKACLDLQPVAKAIEAFWKQNHTEAVKKEQEQINSLERTAEEIRGTISGLNQQAEHLKGEIAGLNAEKARLHLDMQELQKRIESAKIEAQQKLEGELKRLAQSPATMALLGAWTGQNNKPTERTHPLIRVQRPASELPRVPDLKTALLSNLKTTSLSPMAANELTTVCRAALATGQVMAFTSMFGDQLAEAVASALGRPQIVWADIPAGILDPVDWDELVLADWKGYSLVLQNANRSDISLVLGSMRPSLQRQALGTQKAVSAILLTLEANPEMQVASDQVFGPWFDERVLRFTSAKAGGAYVACPDFASQLFDPPAVSTEEFAEIGQALHGLPLLALPARQVVFRRAYGALKRVCEKEADAPRLLFKYWCLPRCSPEDVRTTLQAHKDSWAQDKTLLDLKESMDRNG